MSQFWLAAVAPTFLCAQLVPAWSFGMSRLVYQVAHVCKCSRMKVNSKCMMWPLLPRNRLACKPT